MTAAAAFCSCPHSRHNPEEEEHISGRDLAQVGGGSSLLEEVRKRLCKEHVPTRRQTGRASHSSDQGQSASVLRIEAHSLSFVSPAHRSIRIP